MTITAEQQNQMLEAARPLIQWLEQNGHPHCSIQVTQSSVELTEGIATCRVAQNDDLTPGPRFSADRPVPGVREKPTQVWPFEQQPRDGERLPDIYGAPANNFVCGPFSYHGELVWINWDEKHLSWFICTGGDAEKTAGERSRRSRRADLGDGYQAEPQSTSAKAEAGEWRIVLPTGGYMPGKDPATPAKFSSLNECYLVVARQGR